MSPAPHKIAVLDGYNVMHRDPDFRRVLGGELSLARQELIRKSAAWLDINRSIAELYVVFDGNSAVANTRRESLGKVRVVYTETGESADDWILSFVRSAANAADYTVVSDDNNVSRNSRGLGAEVMRVSEFCAALDRKQQNAREMRSSHTKEALSPGAERDINEAMKKVWGID